MIIGRTTSLAVGLSFYGCLIRGCPIRKLKVMPLLDVCLCDMYGGKEDVLEKKYATN